MKKIIALTALMIAVSSAAYAAGTALASGATLTTGNGEVIHGGADATAAAADAAPVLGRLSKGVHLGVNYQTDAALNGYALHTKHNTGSKQYGTAFDSTAIFSMESSSAVTAPSAASATTFSATGWTAM